MILLTALAVLFLELLLLVKIGARVGGLTTLLLVIVTAAGGLALVRGQGIELIKRVRVAEREGRLPAIEVIDAVLLIVAAVLLVVPGFLTDALGLLILFPATRPFFRGVVLNVMRKRIRRGKVVVNHWPEDRRPPGRQQPGPPPGPGDGPIIDVEAEPVDDKDDPSERK